MGSRKYAHPGYSLRTLVCSFTLGTLLPWAWGTTGALAASLVAPALQPERASNSTEFGGLRPIHVEWRVLPQGTDPMILPEGARIRLGLYAVSDEPYAFFGMTLFFEWDADHLQLLGVDDTGGAPAFLAGLLQTGDPEEICDINEVLPPADGNGYYVWLTAPGVRTNATPEGTLITTFEFDVLSVEQPTFATVAIVDTIMVEDTECVSSMGGDGAVILGNVDAQVFWLVQGCFTAADCGPTECAVATCPSGVCAYTPNDLLCDNGAYCDGVETCNGFAGCEAGVPVECPDDGIYCTIDACNELTDSCENAPDDDRCNDGAFCDGEEFCEPHLGCMHPAPPCPAYCDEVNDICYDCEEDTDCDNDLFCDGEETCDDRFCVSGVDPCPTLCCLEDDDRCVDFPLPGTGNFDEDCDVDLDDYAYFTDCLNGPDEPGGTPLEHCLSAFDTNDDGDVDLADFAGIQRTCCETL